MEKQSKMSVPIGVKPSHLYMIQTSWYLAAWKEKIRQIHIELKHNFDLNKGFKYMQSGGEAVGNEVSEKFIVTIW